MRSRGFSQSFAKVQALFIVEMIDKGEDSMKAFTSSVMKMKKINIETCFGESSHSRLYHI